MILLFVWLSAYLIVCFVVYFFIGLFVSLTDVFLFFVCGIVSLSLNCLCVFVLLRMIPVAGTGLDIDYDSIPHIFVKICREKSSKV